MSKRARAKEKKVLCGEGRVTRLDGISVVSLSHASRRARPSPEL